MRDGWRELLHYMRDVAMRSPPRPTRVELSGNVVMWFDCETGRLVNARTISGVMRRFLDAS